MKKFFVCSVMVGLLAACSAKVDEDGAEVKIDKDAKEAVSENLEKAGDELERGAEKAKEKLADAGEAIKEGFNETKEKLTDDTNDDAKVEVEVKKD